MNGSRKGTPKMRRLLLKRKIFTLRNSIRANSPEWNSSWPVRFSVTDAIHVGLGTYLDVTSGAAVYGPAWYSSYKVDPGKVLSIALELRKMNQSQIFDDSSGIWDVPKNKSNPSR